MDSATEMVPPMNLPLEIWDLVFGHVSNEADLLNCYNACTSFGYLLQSKIYAQALAVVQRQVSGTSLQLEEKDILTCRLVSRDWRKMTDHYLQSRASRLELSCYRSVSLGYQHSFGDQIHNAPNRFGAICLKMGKLEEAHSLVERITSNARVKKGANVLIGRHLAVVGNLGRLHRSEDIRDAEKQRFYDIVTRLLTACGQHIWYLSVWDGISDGAPHLLFNTYWEWFKLVPHLKMLTCNLTLVHMVTEKRLEVQNQVRAGITKHPFPRLPQLVTLQCNGVPDILLHSALEVNRQIKKVEVIPFRYKAYSTLDIERWGSTPLTEFCLTPFKIAELAHLTETGWPLEKLTIRFSLEYGPQQRDVEYHLEQLSTFGETLKYLRMEIPYRVLDPQEIQWKLALPHLEELHLDVLNQARLDFIQPLTSLKTLKLSIMYYEDEVKPPLVMQGSRTPMNELYRSPIWNFMPSLKMVQVEMVTSVTAFTTLVYNRTTWKNLNAA